MRCVAALAFILAASATALAAQTAERAGAASVGPETIEVPLRERAGRLYVPVRTADGSTLDFLLSTASSVTVLSESGARAVGDGGSLTFAGRAVPLSGSQTLADADLTVDGKVFDGMIGSNALNRFDLLVDAPAGRLLLKSPGPSVEWPGVPLAEPLRLQVFHGVILGLDVEVEGTVYPALLDLGTPGVLANARVMTDAALRERPARSLRIGGATFEDVRVQETDHPVIRAFSAGDSGFVLVGASVALECVLSLSWVHRELRTCVR
jgi:hypothetical protein